VQSDKEESNSNDFQCEVEVLECRGDCYHEKSDFEEKQCYENSDFGDKCSSLNSDCWSEKYVFGEDFFSESSEEIHADSIEDDSTLNTGSLYRIILQEQGIDKVRYQYGEILTNDKYDVWNDAVDLVEDSDKTKKALKK
jgi:hypothetical protein